MAVLLGEFVDEFARYVESLDAGAWSGDQAAEATQHFARIQHLAETGLALAGRRATECRAHARTGHRNEAEWLATVAGTPVGKAQQALIAAEQMEANPVLDQACRAGRLSGDQAGEIANVVKESPDAAGHLIDTASQRGFKGLKNACRAVARHAASAEDDQQRLEAIHRSRYYRTWIDSDGAGRLEARMTAAQLAEFNSLHHPYVERAFAEARREGKREKPECYALDALLDMAADRAGAGPPPAEDEPYDPDVSTAATPHEAALELFEADSRPPPAPDSPPPRRRAGVGPPKTIIVLISHEALLRGHSEEGETCLIRGLGSVPVSAVRAWLDDAFLAAVIKDAIDIRTVTHLGRSATAAQRTALYARDRTCVVPGCDTETGLEIDHVIGWEPTHETKLDDLAFLCHHHHQLKTHEGWTLSGEPNRRRFDPPAGGPLPGPFDDDGLDLQPGAT